MAKKAETTSQASQQEAPVQAGGILSGASPALLLLVGALIGLGGLLIGGASGYALGRMQDARLGAPAPQERAFLGVGVLYVDEGALVHALHPDGPAEQAGLLVGDVIVRLDGQSVGPDAPLEPIVQGLAPGDEISITITRGGQRETLDVTLGAVPDDLRPVPLPLRPDLPDFPGEQQPYLGIITGDDDARGVLVERVVPGSSADEAGLRSGDVILTASGQRVNDVAELREQISAAGIGGELALEVRRGDRRLDLVAQVGAQVAPEPLPFDRETAYLGVTVETFTRESARELDLDFVPGVLLLSVEADSPARRAELRERDVITALDGETVRGLDLFTDMVRSRAPGDVVSLDVLREGDSLDVEVALGSRAPLAFERELDFEGGAALAGPPLRFEVQPFTPGCPPGAEECL